MGLGLSNALFPMHFGQKFVENGQFEIFSNFHFLKKFQIFASKSPKFSKIWRYSDWWIWASFAPKHFGDDAFESPS